MRSTHSCWKIASCSLFSLLAACANFTYEAPPEPTLIQPEGGAFQAGQPLEVEFDQPIDPDTVRVSIWQTQLDEEQQIPADASPIIEECQLTEGTCGDLTIEAIEEDGEVRKISLELDPMGLGTPGSPLILEILPGVMDLDGADLGRSVFYDFQFAVPEGGFNTEPVEFLDGTYIISSVVTKPIPAVLTLISDVKVLSDGRFFLAGGEGDEINGAPKTTTDPENLIVDPYETGWSAYIEGFVQLTEDGKRLLKTDPIDVLLPVDPFLINMKRMRLVAEIVKNEEGNDQIEGTLTFEALEVTRGNRVIEYDGGAEALVGLYVPPEKAPANHPLICGDRCGAIIGLCEVPEDFADEQDDVCPQRGL